VRQVLVTGCAGFIGYHLAERLLADGDRVVGYDNVNDYYDVRLKRARLARLARHPNFVFVEADLADGQRVAQTFGDHKFEVVFHLAAQAGVRHSLTHPHAYVDANLVGFLNVLEGCRHNRVGHLLFASSSSVYGTNSRQPFSSREPVDHPISLYAATKKANEMMAHSYAHLFGVPCTGLRFFTVYGPWGRPDMAMFKFADAILAGRPIDVFNHGDMERDFTYVDDVIESVVRLGRAPAAPDPGWSQDRPDTSHAPYRIHNVGNSNPVPLLHLIGLVEKNLGRTAIQNRLPMQPGDVRATSADTAELEAAIDYKPSTTLEVGVKNFIDWYREWFAVTP
jgi:UDP-glucuronate 4-epimerase